MTIPSPFQFLPLFVVKLIVDHVVSSSRMEFDEVWTDSQKYKALLKPLLQVSRNFRAIALPLYCNYFKIKVSLSSQDAHGVYDLSSNHSGDRNAYKYLGHTTHHLAKELEIELDERAVYSGMALEALSRAPYDGCAFPLVRKIALSLAMEELDDEDEGIEVDLSRAEANIREFVERIKQIAPTVSEIRVQLGDFETELTDNLVGYLASQLYQLVGRIDYDYQIGTTAPIWQHLDTIRNLTHITYTSADSDKGVLQSVRQNASTLQVLSFESEYNYVDICGIIRNTDDFDDHERVVSPDVVPFPSLQQLMLMPEYPFGDDVVFRGNASTLKYLELGLTSSTASLLRGFNVFMPGSHPLLQHATFEFYEGGVLDLFATPIDYAQFVLGIGPRSHMRSIGISSVRQPLLSAFSSHGAHSCIQVLKLSNTPGLWDVFTLVKSLPLLTDLHTCAPAIDNFPYNATKEELLVHVISNYTLVSERLRFWHISSSCGGYDKAALSVLLLALVCPNFTHAATFHCQREPLMKAMEEIIDSDAFQPYAPRLRRLLFKGWNSKQD
ncbi:hypothetical protein LPJ71_001033 [Coemansia sp. S17]|nr:hypothetical protein LPJ71_001033 [Coemansia sp. S17]